MVLRTDVLFYRKKSLGASEKAVCCFFFFQASEGKREASVERNGEMKKAKKKITPVLNANMYVHCRMTRQTTTKRPIFTCKKAMSPRSPSFSSTNSCLQIQVTISIKFCNLSKFNDIKIQQVISAMVKMR